MKDEFCQSCGMPLSEEVKGTEKDSTKSNDYCSYCYQDGKFSDDYTMKEMIEINLQYLAEYNKMTNQEMTEDEARKYLEEQMPNWQRWKCTCTDECASGYNPACTCISSECHCRETNLP